MVGHKKIPVTQTQDEKIPVTQIQDENILVTQTQDEKAHYEAPGFQSSMCLFRNDER